MEQQQVVKTRKALRVDISESAVSKLGDFVIPSSEHQTLKIPGLWQSKLQVAFVRALDLPEALCQFMSVNPRVPEKGKVKRSDIITLLQNSMLAAPDEFVLKNGGIYILAESSDSKDSSVRFRLTDRSKHGIVNGGHTFIAIVSAVAEATPEQREVLSKVYVKLNIFTDIDLTYVPDMAEALNFAKPVDRPSLLNLKKEFAFIKRTFNTYPWAPKIAYYQGDVGDVYITKIVAMLEAFNTRRFSDSRHPHNLYAKQSLALDYYVQDVSSNEIYFKKLVGLLPEILMAYDLMKKEGAEAAISAGYEFPKRAQRSTYLPFFNDTVDYQLPNGWVYPMLAALRAGINTEGEMVDIPDLPVLAHEVIPSLIEICVAEWRKGVRPEHIGKREDIYVKCYKTVLHHIQATRNSRFDILDKL